MPQLEYQPVTTMRAYVNIATQIEETIASGQLQTGDQLPGERELAEQFGVSRVVIREAMRNLEARGIVEVRHGSGTYISGMPSPTIAQSVTLLLKLEEASLQDLYVVRQALELVAAPMAAQYATEEEIAALHKCLGEMAILVKEGIDSEDSFHAFSNGDEELHRLIAVASHNMPLGTLLDAILPLVMSGRREIIHRTNGFRRFIVRSGRENAHEEHVNIVNAVANHDPKAAEHFVYHHLQRSMTTFRDLE